MNFVSLNVVVSNYELFPKVVVSNGDVLLKVVASNGDVLLKVVTLPTTSLRCMPSCVASSLFAGTFYCNNAPASMSTCSWNALLYHTNHIVSMTSA